MLIAIVCQLICMIVESNPEDWARCIRFKVRDEQKRDA